MNEAPILKLDAEKRKKLFIRLGVAEVHFGDFPDTEVPSSNKAVNFLEAFYDNEKT